MSPSFIRLETDRGLDHGPLVPHVAAYIERARTEGYPPKTVLVHVQLIASLNRYLRRTRRETSDIDEKIGDPFFTAASSACFGRAIIAELGGTKSEQQLSATSAVLPL